MSEFNAATFEATIASLTSGLGTVSATCGEAQIAANAALANPLVVGWLADAIVWAFDKLIEGARWLIDRIGELLQNAIAPVQMALNAFSWIDDVQKPMNTLSDSIQPRNLANDDQWSGVAAKAYRRGVETQDDAARAIAGVGATMAVQLGVCAAAGLAFYIALGVIVVKFIAAMATAIAAFGTAVFSWAGLLLVVEEAAITPAMIIAAVSGLATVLGVSSNAMIQTRTSMANFPGANWPVGTN